MERFKLLINSEREVMNMDGSSIAVIVVALIGAIATITSNIVMNNKQSAAMDAKLDKQQGIIEERLSNLKESVDKHNNFAQKIPAIEANIEHLEKRIDKLESKLMK